jgi:hypothetical protein
MGTLLRIMHATDFEERRTHIMATEQTHDTEGTAAAEKEAQTIGTSTSIAWYRRVGEDWWATIIGLILVTLILVRLLSSIPW